MKKQDHDKKARSIGKIYVLFLGFVTIIHKKLKNHK